MDMSCLFRYLSQLYMLFCSSWWYQDKTSLKLFIWYDTHSCLRLLWKIEKSSTPVVDSVITWGLFIIGLIIPSFIFLLFLSDIVSCLRLTLDHALHFENNHLLMKTIQKYYCNNSIKSSASNKFSSQPYHLLKWLVTVSW